MKVLTIITSGLEAQMISNLLNSNDIEVFVNGSKQYASIITGSDEGRYELKVTEQDFEKALEILEGVNQTATSGGVASDNKKETLGNMPTPLSESSLLKRSVLFALMGSFSLPVIFNLSSGYYLFRYSKEAKFSVKKVLWVLFIIILNILSLIFISRVYKYY